jgi:hypothetical protein
MGSFEAWSRTLSGVLHAAGIEGFLQNSKALYERSVEDTPMWEAFLETLHKIFGDEKVTARQIADSVQGQEHKDLREVLPDEFGLLDENLSRRLGKAFAKREGVRFGAEGYHLARAGEHAKTLYWAILRTGDGAGGE